MRVFDINEILKESECNLEEKDIIKSAYNYASEKHFNQKRKSGEPYIIHPLFVAYIVAKMGLDYVTISSALLHDVIEDTSATYEDVYKRFGKEIASVVEGVTKLKKSFQTNEQMKKENYQKLFHAMEKDVRVILLKLADRLHNVYTLEYLDRKKQIAIAKETIEIYAPIAGQLGLVELKESLDKGAKKFLDISLPCVSKIDEEFIFKIKHYSVENINIININKFIENLELEIFNANK